MKETFIRDIMKKNVTVIASTLSIREIAKIMARDDVSGVAVENPERGIVGIVAECDILRHLGEKNWELRTAEEIMSPNVEAIRPETTLEKAADDMQKHHIHRLLVFDRSLSDPAMPIGIISASDIVKQIGRDSI